MTVQPTRDQLEAELDSWMTRAYEAEKRAWQAEAELDQERKWRLELDAAHDEEIENAERAEARIKAVRDVLDSYDNIRRYLSDPVINTCSEIRSALEGTN